jgi:hypothetical protein
MVTTSFAQRHQRVATSLADRYLVWALLGRAWYFLLPSVYETVTDTMSPGFIQQGISPGPSLHMNQ